MAAPHRIVLLALLVVLASCGRESRCGPPRPPTPLDHATTGTLSGTVTLEGAPPPMKTISLGGDPQCAAEHAGPVLSGDALVHDGRVENVFVWVKEGLGDRTFAVPDAPVIIDQVGCLYQPHVAGAQTCQPIEFVNSDPLLHNVHGLPEHSPPWNFGMVHGSKRTARVEHPEVMIDIQCDVHPWMRAYLGVLDHPYFAVTGADGRFTLAALPPGDYVIGAWHERFGTRETRVTLGPGEQRAIAFTYVARP